MPKGNDDGDGDGDEITMDGRMEEWNGTECLLSLFSLPSFPPSCYGDSKIKMDSSMYYIFRIWGCRARPRGGFTPCPLQ